MTLVIDFHTRVGRVTKKAKYKRTTGIPFSTKWVAMTIMDLTSWNSSLAINETTTSFSIFPRWVDISMLGLLCIGSINIVELICIGNIDSVGIFERVWFLYIGSIKSVGFPYMVMQTIGGRKSKELKASSEFNREQKKEDQDPRYYKEAIPQTMK